MMISSPRTAAAVTLRRVLGDGAYSNIAVGSALERADINIKDRALFSRIVMTALERIRPLELVVSEMCRKKPDPVLRGLLLAGAAQILYMDRIPQSAAVDETVKAAKELTDERRAGFVNAVLRGICRRRAELLLMIGEAPDDIRLSLDKSVINLIKRQYPGMADSFAEAFFAEPPMFIRVNTTKITSDELRDRLISCGCEVGEKDGFMYVASGCPEALTLLGEGLFFVQGAASQYASAMLGASEGDTVIDVCACPGGKSLSAAVAMNNRGKIIALDIHENKLPLIRSSAEKLGISVISTAVCDSRNPLPQYAGVADRVICDVPCSALGVIASRPEIRYRDVSDLSPLIATQYAILCASATYLRRGGVMVYSTCTFDRDENAAQTERFIKEHGDFTVTEEKQFLPDLESEGFYCCRMVKNG